MAHSAVSALRPQNAVSAADKSSKNSTESSPCAERKIRKTVPPQPHSGAIPNSGEFTTQSTHRHHTRAFAEPESAVSINRQRCSSTKFPISTLERSGTLRGKTSLECARPVRFCARKRPVRGAPPRAARAAGRTLRAANLVVPRPSADAVPPRLGTVPSSGVFGTRLEVTFLEQRGIPHGKLPIASFGGRSRGALTEILGWLLPKFFDQHQAHAKNAHRKKPTNINTQKKKAHKEKSPRRKNSHGKSSQ
ncbi:hypothetical protein TcasGA2_TC011943 [Tribolium castaneum]|uniref:Uncharacterized protein n=1 Tax=Tribolium castaneum TaxID=7070 RepID=D6X350_TRICA|nr:hypothetical protein TcasGA2_TC011943 [Tribolium castaneum]